VFPLSISVQTRPKKTNKQTNKEKNSTDQSEEHEGNLYVGSIMITLVPEVFLDFSPYERATRSFFLIFLRMRELRGAAKRRTQVAKLAVSSHAEKNQEKLWDQGT